MPAAHRYSFDPDRFSKAAFYSLSATNAIAFAGIAFGTASAGHLFAARFAPTGAGANLLFHVTRLRILWQTLAGFTAAQELAIAAYKITAVSAYSSSTQVPVALAPGYGASQLLGYKSGTSAAISGGGPTIGGQLLRGGFAELAAGATVQKGFIDEELLATVHPVVVLAANEGILVRNEILMGAGGLGRLTVELDGYERAA
jgi:uncharacterized membrane protein